MKKIVILLILVLLQYAVNSYAADIRIDGANGVYKLTGVDFVDIGGVEVEVQYDTATLSNPRITVGSMLSSTTFLPNLNFTVSSVKIAALSTSLLPIKGSGDLAVITFAVKGDKAGSVFIKRKKLAAMTSGTKVATDPKAESEAKKLARLEAERLARLEAERLARLEAERLEVASQNGNATTDTTYGSSSMGTITLPQDQLASVDRKTEYQPLVTDLRKDMTIPLSGTEAAKAAATASPDGTVKDKTAEKKFESYTSSLQLFKAYKGERNIKSLISLFADAELTGFTQTPPVAIADGKTPIIIKLVLKIANDASPTFIMQGATVKQLSHSDSEKSTWIIEALPKKDVFDARMTVIDGERMFDYPLTVAPKIDTLLTKGKKLSEADFTFYLVKPPKFDFNADKKFDAIDDFIYTANYIVTMKIKPEKSAKPEIKEKGAKPEAKEKGAKPEAKEKGAKPEAKEKDVKPEVKEKNQADKKAVPAGKEPATKGSTLKDGESAPNKPAGKN